MKRKILFIALLLFVLLSGVAIGSAATTWNGFPITKILSNGKALLTSDTPPIIIDGHAYVPIYLLRQIGLEVTWDSDTSSVEAKIPIPLSDAQIAEISKSVGLVQVYQDNKYVGQGSGFMISGGVFITNCHVGCVGNKLIITLDGKTYTTHGESLFKNEETDVFGVKINALQGLPYIQTVAPVGTHVVAIGYPHAKYQVSRGWIGAVTKIRETTYVDSTAPIDSGSSGGVLLNEDGKVVGITSNSTDSIHGGLAVSIIDVIQELDKLK